MTKSLKTIASISLLILAFNSQASDLTIPNQFTSGTRAVAADVNANFDAAAVAVTDNQTQLTNLIAQIAALTTAVNILQTDNSNLQAEVDTLKADSVAGLSGVLSVGTDNQGNTAVIFSGVNLHINNGTGTTSSEINGLGNIIVGYDEVTDEIAEYCSEGAYSDQFTCETNLQIWSNVHKSGSHNIIIGEQHNYARHSGLIVGRKNDVYGNYSLVMGFRNVASGFASSVTGGSNNKSSGSYSSISGGLGNRAKGSYSGISGGEINDSSGLYSIVSGGYRNEASGLHSVVSGGRSNQATGEASSISGGNGNTASGYDSSISGGSANIASGDFSSISGGTINTASGVLSSISGGYARNALGSFDWRAGSLFDEG